MTSASADPVPGEHELAVLEFVDHLLCHLRTHRRATLAATDSALTLAPQRIHVVGGVDHDGAVAGQIIEARLQTVHAQRITMGSLVTFLGAEQPEAGLVAAFAIGELSGEVFPEFEPWATRSRSTSFCLLRSKIHSRRAVEGCE